MKKCKYKRACKRANKKILTVNFLLVNENLIEPRKELLTVFFYLSDWFIWPSWQFPSSEFQVYTALANTILSLLKYVKVPKYVWRCDVCPLIQKNEKEFATQRESESEIEERDAMEEKSKGRV